MTDLELADKFEKRVLILGNVYPYIKPYLVWATQVPAADDNELYYEIDKMDLIEYFKKIFFRPG